MYLLPEDSRMNQEDILKLRIEQMQESLADYVQTKNWKDQLVSLDQLRRMNLHLATLIERLENKLRQDFHNQTGLRACGDIWKRLPWTAIAIKAHKSASQKRNTKSVDSIKKGNR